MDLEPKDGIIDIDAIANEVFPPISIIAFGKQYSVGEIKEDDLVQLASAGQGDGQPRLSTLLAKILGADTADLSGQDFRKLALISKAVMDQFQAGLDGIGMGNVETGKAGTGPSPS